MAGISTTFANHVLDAILGAGYTPPATVYAALTTVAPTAAMTGSTITEPSQAQYSGYARVAVTNNATNWPAASGGAKSNGTAITFPTSAGGASSPVTVSWFAICDAVTAGNLITFGALTTAQSIANGDTPSFAVGALSFSES